MAEADEKTVEKTVTVTQDIYLGAVLQYPKGAQVAAELVERFGWQENVEGGEGGDEAAPLSWVTPENSRPGEAPVEKARQPRNNGKAAPDAGLA